MLRHVATAPDLRDSLKLGIENVAAGNEKPREACGIFGAHIPGHEAARAAFFGIFALQHRGQESAGIAASNGTSLSLTAEIGLVSQVFQENDLADLPGHLAIAHTRYSTTGSNRRHNAQPLLAYGPRGAIAVGHNGNVINAMKLREFCREEYGSVFTGSTDSEVIAELFAKTPGENWFDVSDKVMGLLSGAYSLIMMTKHDLIAVRDPLGVRPLCLGELDGGSVFASETAALDNLGAKFVRELEPGEVIIVNRDGIENWVWPRAAIAHKMCIFEQIYFARPDSILVGSLAYEKPDAHGCDRIPRKPDRSRFGNRHPGLVNTPRCGIRGGGQHPIRRGIGQKPICRAYIHPTRPVHARYRRQNQVQRDAASRWWQEDRGG